MAATRSLGRDITTEEWESFEFQFGLVPEHIVQTPLPDSSLYSPSEGKFDIPIALFEAVGDSNPLSNFLWVNNDLVVLSYPRDQAYVDRDRTRFGVDKELVNVLEKININGEDWLDCFLVAGRINVAWRERGKIPECGGSCFFRERALQGQFDDELQCRDVDLVEDLSSLFLDEESRQLSVLTVPPTPARI
ncbi:unnamed protein product [Lactuca saligna]|uniref:Uncharacterized protein n=1 Tax=Lactuca saligna TaxID=75948 RepID=A0AA35ZY03_LACSI|nr:unnamed protein product [Lactuca saligna]